MKIPIHKDVQMLVEELNQVGESAIFGGYLRDMYLGLKPSDVDIVTKIPIETVEAMYSHLEKAKKRKTDSGHDVFSFKMHRTEKIFVEIIATDKPLIEKAKQADYTMNSLLYDGKKILNIENGLEDLQAKIIREVRAEIIQHDLQVRPYLWLKTIRMTSMTNSQLSKTTFDLLNNNKHCIENISPEILQNEGHKTLHGKNPVNALRYLSQMGFIAPFEEKGAISEKEFTIQPQQQLCLLAIATTKQTIDDYVKLYAFQPGLIEKYEKLYVMYKSEERPPSRFRNQLLNIKKILQ